jgi:predicted ATPase
MTLYDAVLYITTALSQINDYTIAPIIAKYDELDPSTQRAVQAAAVVGADVPLDILSHLCRVAKEAKG